jgi:signal transduction histidine kinase
VKIPRPSAPTVVTCALLVLLPAFAVLQYRWVGQVSVAEQERMQRNLRNAANQFREAFDGEIARAFLSLQIGAATARDGATDRYADRFETWLNTAEHPQVVANVFVVDDEERRLRLRRWNHDTRALEAAGWVGPVGQWREQFQKELDAFVSSQPIDRRDAFRNEPSLLVAPMRTLVLPSQTGLGPQTFVPVFGFTVLQLDMTYVREQLLPELAERHFSHPDADTAADRFRVAVIDNHDETGTVLFRTDAAAPVRIAEADVTLGLLGPGDTAFFFGRRGGPGRDGRRDRAGDFGDGRRSDGRFDTGGRNDNRDDDEDDSAARWRLLVQHESGSLEAAVATVRRRNLAISFGVLGLLSISVALLTVTSRRAHTLARQQMEFVAGISHELRTPVAVIRSAGENLSQGVVGNVERVKQYGQMIEGEARRLGDMVERVLQYAGIESGLGFTERAPLAPGELIEAAIRSEESLADPNGLLVHREIAAELPPVLGDAAALRSAVQNLLANAVKYGGTDRWVGIRAEHHRERSEVRITVSDHGAGIPSGELPHIFEPFYRGADALARQIHGNGLGLSLVRRIVTAHGGKVTVTSRAGTGSSFTITLPVAKPDPQTGTVAETHAPVHS